MTIQEALRSGLLFKRPVHYRYMQLSITLGGVYFKDSAGMVVEYKITIADVFANDWETKDDRPA